MAISLCNTGTTELACAPTIDGHNQGFSIVTGAESESLLPNDCREILVRFEPAYEGYFPARLVLGQGLPALPFIGSTGAIADSCGVDETVLSFGSIEANQTLSRPVRIANTSDQVIRISPQSDSPRFVVNGFIGDLLPGDSATIYVIFSPEGEGDWTGTISTGHPMCSQIECSGDSYRIPNVAPDRLGIYFNGSFTENEIESEAGGIVEAAIVLINPSAETGVLGWECTVGIEGEAMMLDWNLEGDALNIAGAPEFIVGLTRAPLPYAQAIRLATFRVLVLTDETPSFLSVGPTSVPSIAGRMAWAPRDFANLIPLYSVTGGPVVAAINGAVAADIPSAPGIAYANSRVHLHWLVPEAVGSAFLVYRRVGDSEPELLTQAPVPVSDGVASFTDRPTGYAAGTRLYYSYATVQDGLESARSDEALFTVDDTPVLVTRLLPSFPNPFNPQTKIQFEIARAGRVQVAIYDLSGRLVKTLVDGHMEVGSDTRIWQGRDNEGRPVASGSYFVRLSTEGKVDHQKVMLLK